MSLGTKRAPRVKTPVAIKLLFTVLKAIADNPQLATNGRTTVTIYRDLYQKAVNQSASQEKPPRATTTKDGTGNTVLAFPVDDSVAKTKISMLLDKYANDKRHVPNAKNVDMFGNVKIYSEGSGDGTTFYYLEKGDDGKLVKTPLPENAAKAKFPPEITDPAISGFVPGERVKQNIDDMFAEASAAEFDADSLLAEYDLK